MKYAIDTPWFSNQPLIILLILFCFPSIIQFTFISEIAKVSRSFAFMNSQIPSSFAFIVGNTCTKLIYILKPNPYYPLWFNTVGRPSTHRPQAFRLDCYFWCCDTPVVYTEFSMICQYSGGSVMVVYWLLLSSCCGIFDWFFTNSACGAIWFSVFCCLPS